MEDLVREDIDVGTDDRTVTIKLHCKMEREDTEGDFSYSPIVDEVGQILLVPDYEWCSFVSVEKAIDDIGENHVDNKSEFTTMLVSHMLSDTGNFEWFVNIDEIGNVVITPDDESASFISVSKEGDLNVAEELPNEEEPPVDIIEPLHEGTWSVPKTVFAVRKLSNILSKPITTANAKEVKDALYSIMGDDSIYDKIDGLEDGEDARYFIKDYLLELIPANEDRFTDRVYKELMKVLNRPLKEGVNNTFIAVVHIDDEDGTWCKVEAPTQEQAADYILHVMSEKHPDASHIRVDVDDVVRILGESILSEDDELETPEQEFSSAKTSINSSKLPAIFGMVDFKPDTLNLDYGGGKFDNAVKALAQKGVTNVVYDPYNRTASHNSSVLKQVRANGGADTITCSNVLNVIKEEEVRMSVLRNMKSLVKPSGVVYITVYEGSGDGVGKETSSGYQLNRKTADYIAEVSRVFPSAYRKGKLIIAGK